MERKRIFILCFVLFTILGSLLHFAFDILGNNTFIGLFTPVNESIWEHFKLVLIPSTLFVFLLVILKKDILNSSVLALCFAVILSCIFIYLSQIIYNYTGLKHNVVFSIISYILSMFICFFLIYIFSNNSNLANGNYLGIITIFLIYLLFMCYTIHPPKLEIFRDSITNNYGIKKL